MLVPLLRVLPLSKSENMFLVAVVCVWGGGEGGDCSMSFRLDIFGDYTMENFKTCLNIYQKTIGAVLFASFFMHLITE